MPHFWIDTVKHKAVLEAESLLADQSSWQPHPAVPTVPEPADQEAAVPPAAKKKKSLASFFKQSTATNTTLTKKESIENELSSYLQSASIQSDADPLEGWKEHECVFPALSYMAKKHLCAHATSSPSERVFSCSGNIVICHGAAVKADAVDRL